MSCGGRLAAMRPYSKSTDKIIWSRTCSMWRCRSAGLLLSLLVFSVAIYVPVTTLELVNPLELVRDVTAVTTCRLEGISSARVEFPAHHCEDVRYSADDPSPIQFLSFDVVPFYKLDDNEYCRSYLNITWSVELIHTATDKSSSSLNSSHEANEDAASQYEYSSHEMNEDAASQYDYSSQETNEDSTSQDDKDTSSETDADLESSAKITTSDDLDLINKLIRQGLNQLTFRLIILPHALNGANLCAVISLSLADIVNRSVSFDCLRLDEGSYGFALYVERKLDDNTIEYMDVKDQNNVIINTINSCKIPEIPSRSAVVTSPLPTPSLIVADSIGNYNSVIVAVSVMSFVLTLIITGLVVWSLRRKWIERTIPRTSVGESRSLVSDSSVDSVGRNSVRDSVVIVPPSC